MNLDVRLRKGCDGDNEGVASVPRGTIRREKAKKALWAIQYNGTCTTALSQDSQLLVRGTAKRAMTYSQWEEKSVTSGCWVLRELRGGAHFKAALESDGTGQKLTGSTDHACNASFTLPRILCHISSGVRSTRSVDTFLHCKSDLFTMYPMSAIRCMFFMLPFHIRGSHGNTWHNVTSRACTSLSISIPIPISRSSEKIPRSDYFPITTTSISIPYQHLP